MGMPMAQYRSSVHTFSESENSMALAITELGDGIWRLAIPHNTDSVVVAEFVRGTVFDGLDLQHPRIYAEDLDDHTLVYAIEADHDGDDIERGSNPR